MLATREDILNVTLLEPRQKHPTVFAWFDALNEGESFTIHNDHDPKPLYYQILGERGNIFTWEYLEQGPEWWKVRIGKNPAGSKDETLGDIAAKDLRKAQVFQKYGLDFCCGGKNTIKQACRDKGIDVTKVEYELQQIDRNFSARPLPYDEWNLDFLADYIVNTHHSYIKKSLPEIREYATKVAQLHGGLHPEVISIQQIVVKIYDELLPHLKKEEEVLFPLIKQLAASSSQNTFNTCRVSTIHGPVSVMETEHESIGKALEEIRLLSNNYALPEDACASYSLLYRMLEEFESDLQIHVHLENNILFPKALALEKN